MKKYPVVEIFRSVQGEGYWTGAAAVFVRLGGCNLACPFCDTDHVPRSYLSAEEVVAWVRALTRSRREDAYRTGTLAVLTGGEPVLSLCPGDPLVAGLRAHGMRVHLETNGTLPIPEGVELDWITVSPKGNQVVRRGDELKVLYREGMDLTAFDGQDFTHWWLQPIWGPNGPNTQATVEAVEEDPRWRLSTQTHRLLGLR